MIVLITLAILAIIAMTIIALFFIGENSGILDDNTLEDYLNTLSDNYEVYQSEYSHIINPLRSSKLNRGIEKSWKIHFLFPYYIEYVGVIPVWSKHKKRIDAMFATKPRDDWKRKKLGLD
jgi:hypothetical protein